MENWRKLSSIIIKYPAYLFHCYCIIIAKFSNMSPDMTKPTKWLCAQRRHRSAWAFAKSDQIIRPVWSVFAFYMKKAWVLSYSLSAQRRLRSDWADAQADLSLRWAHTHSVGFVMSWLIWQARGTGHINWSFYFICWAKILLLCTTLWKDHIIITGY